MQPDSPYRFALVAHSHDIAEVVRMVADLSLSTYDIQVRIVDFDTAVPAARECLKSGAEVIFCHGGTGYAIFQALGQAVATVERTDADRINLQALQQSVITIERTDMDVIHTLQQARTLSDEVVLAAYQGEEHDIPAMEKLLDMRIHHLAYSSSSALFESIRRHYDLGLRVLVGGGVSKRYMEQLGGVGFVIVPGPENIERAFSLARTYVQQKRYREALHENALTMLRHLNEGAICVNARGETVFVNNQARSLLKALHPATKGHMLLKKFLLPDTLLDRTPKKDMLVDVEGLRFVVTTLPIITREGGPGALALFRDLGAEDRARRKSGDEFSSKGFAARYDLDDIRGESQGIADLKRKILRFAPSAASVLIQGETGTGKELAAHALHKRSGRSGRPFVAVNFAAIPENLVESELFGYDEGAFTGARRGGKPGLFELAHTGTLFLDEISEISAAVQTRLLRVLEAGEVMRVGGHRFTPVDVRVVSASNSSLADLAAQRVFRHDLYYRLSTLKLFLPPLRERLDDAGTLMRKLLPLYGKSEAVIDAAIEARIRAWIWPGNVRELLAVMESYLIQLQADKADPRLFASILRENLAAEPVDMAAAAPGDVADDVAADLPGHVIGVRPGDVPGLPGFDPCLSLRGNMDRVRRNFIAEALKRHGGDKAAAAKALDISYATLWRIHQKTKDAPGAGASSSHYASGGWGE